MSRRDAVTVRFPEKLLAEARELKPADESLNEFVVQAVEQAVRRRRGQAALQAIERVREQVRARTGNQPDATPLIRTMREGRERDG